MRNVRIYKLPCNIHGHVEEFKGLNDGCASVYIILEYIGVAIYGRKTMQDT